MILHNISYSIQKTFAGRSKTVRGPHAARVPMFGPCWNRLSADFSSRVLFYKETNCRGLQQNHNYVFILPSKNCQHHLEKRAATV